MDKVLKFGITKKIFGKLHKEKNKCINNINTDVLSKHDI